MNYTGKTYFSEYDLGWHMILFELGPQMIVLGALFTMEFLLKL